MAIEKLTDRTLFAGTLADSDLIHVVDVDDPSQDPAGSSFKLTLLQLKTFIGAAWNLNGNTVGSLKFLGTLDNFALPFRTNNLERGRFLKTGGFVVGTTTLLLSANVADFFKDQNAATTLFVRNNTDAVNANAGFAASANESNTILVGINSATFSGGTAMQLLNAANVSTDAIAGLNIGTTSNTKMTLWTNDTERITILSNGKVGIKQPTPTSLLHITPSAENALNISGTAAAFGQIALMTNTGANGGVLFLTGGTDANQPVFKVTSGVANGIESTTTASGKIGVRGISTGGGRGVAGTATTVAGTGVEGSFQFEGGVGLKATILAGGGKGLFVNLETGLADNQAIVSDFSSGVQTENGTLDLNVFKRTANGGFIYTGDLVRIEDNGVNTGNLFNVIKNASTVFVITEDGKIGIGTTPGVELDIVGDVETSGQMALFGNVISSARILTINNGLSSSTISEGLISRISYTGTASQVPIGGSFEGTYQPDPGPTVPDRVVGIDAIGITGQREGAGIADVIGGRFRWGAVINTTAPVDAQGILIDEPLTAGSPTFPSGTGFGMRIKNQGKSGMTKAVGLKIETQADSTTNVGLDMDANFMEWLEMTAPSAGAANTARLFVRDVAGKTELSVIFNSGAIQQIAIEP